MAKELTPTTICDWHASLHAPVSIAAGHVRTLENGKEVDVCDVCAWVFDMYYARRESILTMLQPGVLDAFYRSAREPQPSHRVPAQLALATGRAPAQLSSSDKPKAPVGAGSKAKFGAWKDDVVQVRCPLKHRGSARKYWVPLRERTNHAHSHKKGDGTRYDGPDISFELQPGQQFTHFCTEHQVCAENGGYGFISQVALTAHLTKSTGWQRATEEAKDAAETRLQEQAA
ncbi:hypothetical protein [Streptomyces sp. NPDC059080]|uniref:hypothetical protein n=1 Tax=Streptomyces sp. NPDC059080 TaxID=3346718 RepID=UPI00368B74AA